MTIKTDMTTAAREAHEALTKALAALETAAEDGTIEMDPAVALTPGMRSDEPLIEMRKAYFALRQYLVARDAA